MSSVQVCHCFLILLAALGDQSGFLRVWIFSWGSALVSAVLPWQCLRAHTLQPDWHEQGLIFLSLLTLALRENRLQLSKACML